MKRMNTATRWGTTWHGMTSLAHCWKPREVNRARLEYIRSKGDVNKGESINLNHRSHFVAMEFNTHKVDGFFAALDALKMLLSCLAVEAGRSHGGGSCSHGQ